MSKNENHTFEYIITELQSGQERAFDYIFRKYYKALCALANSYINDLDKAQSLVQDSFIKLWVNRQEAGKIKNLPSYLTFMVRNHCIDYIRKTQSLKILHEKAKEGTTEFTSDNLAHSNEFAEKLVVVLSALPKRSRMAFEYSRFENLTYKEIALKMDISVKAVEALIGRALKTLRLELKDYLPVLILFLS